MPVENSAAERGRRVLEKQEQARHRAAHEHGGRGLDSLESL